MLRRLASVTLGIGVSLLWARSAAAQVSIGATTTTIDFTNFAATGFASSPTGSQLDSDAWAIAGFSDGDLAFGGMSVAGDLARGLSQGGVTTAGIYAFDVDNGGGGIDAALGFQPTATEFTPGTITLRLVNNTGGTLTKFNVSYEIHVYNNGDYSTSCNFATSSDNASYTALPGMNFSSPTVPAGATWTFQLRNITVTAAVSNNDYFYLRWSTDDAGGAAGARDEIAIDDIVISPVAICGNGSVDSGETCDDSNSSDGDGCSAVCLVELALDGGTDAGLDAGFDAGADSGDASDAAATGGGIGGDGDAASEPEDASAADDASVFDATAALDGATAGDAGAQEPVPEEPDAGPVDPAGGNSGTAGNGGAAGAPGNAGGISNVAGSAGDSDAGVSSGAVSEDEGCSCTTVGSRAPNGAWAVLVASLALVLGRRTRKQDR